MTSKNLRIGLPEGVAQISMVPKDDGRVSIYVAHEKLGSPDDVTVWKAFWSDWLKALDEA